MKNGLKGCLGSSAGCFFFGSILLFFCGLTEKYLNVKHSIVVTVRFIKLIDKYYG